MRNFKPNEEWGVYESNVQAYRSNFLSSQSILLAVGAITYANSFILTTIIAVISVIQIWYIWFRVIYVRTQILDYHKYAMNTIFDKKGNIRDERTNPQNYLSEQTYIRDKSVRKEVYKNMTSIWGRQENFHTLRLTRIKFDILIPASMTLIWLVLVGFSLATYITH